MYATSHTTPAQAQAAIKSTNAAHGYLRQTGEAFKSAQGKFFISAAAVWLYLGDADARTAAKEAWADSKDKAREYALKVFRACASAATAGRAADIAGVQTFAQLVALTPVKKDEPAKDAPANGANQSPEAEQANAAAAPVPQSSKLDALMDQFGRMQALEARLRTMALNKKASAEDHRRESMDMFKALEALRADMTATLSAPVAAE